MCILYNLNLIFDTSKSISVLLNQSSKAFCKNVWDILIIVENAKYFRLQVSNYIAFEPEVKSVMSHHGIIKCHKTLKIPQ